MATTIVQTAPPTDVFNSGVGGAPLITQAGVNVDNTLLSAVQAAATANNVTLIVGGVGGPASPSSYPPSLLTDNGDGTVAIS